MTSYQSVSSIASQKYYTAQNFPTYTFDELQDIWNLQKAILQKFKNVQVPFFVLDMENKGYLASDDFAYRLMAKGFTPNKSLLDKFFAFMDTDCNGMIDEQDWILGFQNIGTHLVEARAMALDNLKSIHPDGDFLSLSHVKSPHQSPPKKVQSLSNTSSPPRHWDVPKTAAISIQDLAYNPLISPTRNSYNSHQRMTDFPLNLSKGSFVEQERLSYQNNNNNNNNASIKLQDDQPYTSDSGRFSVDSPGLRKNLNERIPESYSAGDLRKEIEVLKQEVDARRSQTGFEYNTESRNSLKGSTASLQKVGGSVVEEAIEKRASSRVMASPQSNNRVPSSLVFKGASIAEVEEAHEVNHSPELEPPRNSSRSQRSATKEPNLNSVKSIPSPVNEERSRTTSQISQPKDNNYPPSVNSLTAAVADGERTQERVGQSSISRGNTPSVQSFSGGLDAKSERVYKNPIQSAPDIHVRRTSERPGPGPRPSSPQPEETTSIRTTNGQRQSSSGVIGSRFSVPQEDPSRSLNSWTETQRIPDDESREQSRKNSHSIRLSINNDAVRTDQATPSWRAGQNQIPAEAYGQDGELFGLIEKLLEEYGGPEEVLSTLNPEDLERFPHLRILLQNLLAQQQGHPGRTSVSNSRASLTPTNAQIHRHPGTTSMVDLRRHRDISLEDVKTNRGRRTVTLTPEPRGSFDREQRALASLKEFSRKNRREMSVGCEAAMEVLDEKTKELEEEREYESIRRSNRESILRGTERGSIKSVHKTPERKRKELNAYEKINKVFGKGKSGEKEKTGDRNQMRKEILTTLQGNRVAKSPDEGIYNSSGYRIRPSEYVVENKKRRAFQPQSRDEEENLIDSKLKKVINALNECVDEMETKIGSSKFIYKTHESDYTKNSHSKLWGMFRPDQKIAKEDIYQGKSEPLTFLKGSPQKSVVHESFELDPNIQYFIKPHNPGEDRFERKSRMTDRYNKLASELKTLNVQVGGPDNSIKFEREKSPLHKVQSNAYNHINVKNFMNQEFTGKGKTYLLSQLTRLDAVNKEFSNSTQSLRKAAQKDI